MGVSQFLLLETIFYCDHINSVTINLPLHVICHFQLHHQNTRGSLLTQSSFTFSLHCY